MTPPSTPTTQSKGQQAENLACQFLQTQGLKLIARNYRCRCGEIDLVMRQGTSLVFVEVRLRNNTRFGGALASVTAKKQEKLRRTALHYLQQHSPNANARFDVVALQGNSLNPDIEWIQNAF
jgi:putative endonuclease